jgi:hypothetical protein
MFAILHLKCFVLFGTGAVREGGCVGEQDGRGGEQRTGVRWTQFHSILFRSDSAGASGLGRGAAAFTPDDRALGCP